MGSNFDNRLLCNFARSINLMEEITKSLVKQSEIFHCDRKEFFKMGKRSNLIDAHFEMHYPLNKYCNRLKKVKGNPPN